MGRWRDRRGLVRTGRVGALRARERAVILTAVQSLRLLELRGLVGRGAFLGGGRMVNVGAGWERWVIRVPLQGLVDFLGFTHGVA